MGEELERRINGFSALQRAEIAEIAVEVQKCDDFGDVSVLFNEPKLLKFVDRRAHAGAQRYWFQCSSTSRNC